jgi:hypothetical protein
MIINILGGMEMFIINIAFKIALASVSILPKNKMLIIDEGVSVLDKHHLEQFEKIVVNHIELANVVYMVNSAFSWFLFFWKTRDNKIRSGAWFHLVS